MISNDESHAPLRVVRVLYADGVGGIEHDEDVDDDDR